GDKTTTLFPHNAVFVERLGALTMPDDMQPPDVSLQPNNLYSSLTFFRNLAHERRLTAAEDGPYGVHDLFSHLLTAYLLIPPKGIDRLQTRAGEALEMGEDARGEAMDTFDANISNVGYGY